MIEVWLDWPDSRLMPNRARTMHWAQKGRVAKAARHAAWVAGLQAGLHELHAASRVRMEFEFSAPDRRKRDLDNLIAAIKPCIDGLADAIGMDDNRFDLAFTLAEPGRGDIRVRIEPR